MDSLLSLIHAAIDPYISRCREKALARDTSPRWLVLPRTIQSSRDLRTACKVLVTNFHVGTVLDMASHNLVYFSNRHVLPVFAVLIQLVVLFPFTLASGLLAPLSGVVALHALWIAHASVLVMLLRRRSGWALFLPLVNASLWWSTMTFGDIVLGWAA